MHPKLSQWLELAVRAALAPSATILSGFRHPHLPIRSKADGTLVTQFDQEAEREIRRVLSSDPENAYPIMGEELGPDTQSLDLRWIVDPIDGTLGYTRGLPTFGTLVALEDVSTERSLVGVIHLPAFAETYSAARGFGAYCNDMPIRVAPRRKLKDCIVSVPGAHYFERAGLQEGYARLGFAEPYLRGNADCWMHAMAARGAIDVVVEFDLCRWDIAASEVLIEEAGGVCLIRPSRYREGRYDVILGSAHGVDDVAKILSFNPPCLQHQS
jgi:histidinol-phosphatase